MYRLLKIIFCVGILFVKPVFADFKEFEKDVSDSVITTKITAKFAKNSHLNILKVFVSTEAGKVSLSGYVKDKDAYLEAVSIAAQTKGVKLVDTDLLKIKQVNTAFTDAYITAKVEAAVLQTKLFDDESIPLVSIRASTTNGIVMLSGEVKSQKSVHYILKRVNAINGVKKIISNLQVESSKVS